MRTDGRTGGAGFIQPLDGRVGPKNSNYIFSLFPQTSNLGGLSKSSKLDIQK